MQHSERFAARRRTALRFGLRMLWLRGRRERVGKSDERGEEAARRTPGDEWVKDKREYTCVRSNGPAGPFRLLVEFWTRFPQRQGPRVMYAERDGGEK